MARTCSTSHTGSIHMNALGGGHTHTYILTLWTKAISRNQLCVSQRLVYMPGLKVQMCKIMNILNICLVT